MRMWVWSLPLLSGVRIQSCHELQYRSQPQLYLAFLWLWHRLAAAALIWLLAWQLPYAMGVALKRKKKQVEFCRKQNWVIHPSIHSINIQHLLRARRSPRSRQDERRQIIKHKKTVGTNKCYQGKKDWEEALLGRFHWGRNIWAETWKWEGSSWKRETRSSGWETSDSLESVQGWHVQETDRNSMGLEHKA